MDGDTLMLGAFALFLGLVVWRWRQLRNEDRKEGNIVLLARHRKIFKIIQLVVLFALLIYMIPRLWNDLHDFTQVVWSEFILRCLIFIITIYILFCRIRNLYRKQKI